MKHSSHLLHLQIQEVCRIYDRSGRRAPLVSRFKKTLLRVALRILDPPMEGFEPVWRRVRVLKIASFEGPMILRATKNLFFFLTSFVCWKPGWWQLTYLWNCSPRKLGKMNPFWLICFQRGWNHQLEKYVFVQKKEVDKSLIDSRSIAVIW